MNQGMKSHSSTPKLKTHIKLIKLNNNKSKRKHPILKDKLPKLSNKLDHTTSLSLTLNNQRTLNQNIPSYTQRQLFKKIDIDSLTNNNTNNNEHTNSIPLETQSYSHKLPSNLHKPRALLLQKLNNCSLNDFNNNNNNNCNNLIDFNHNYKTIYKQYTSPQNAKYLTIETQSAHYTQPLLNLYPKSKPYNKSSFNYSPSPSLGHSQLGFTATLPSFYNYLRNEKYSPQHTLNKTSFDGFNNSHNKSNISFINEKCTEIEHSVMTIQNNLLNNTKPIPIVEYNKARRKSILQKHRKTMKVLNNIPITQPQQDEDDGSNGFQHIKIFSRLKQTEESNKEKDDIMDDVLSKDEINDEKYHERMFSNCRRTTIRALQELNCIDKLNPSVAFHDNKTVKRILILTHDNKYSNKLINKATQDKKRMKKKLSPYKIKINVKEQTCAERLNKKTDALLQMVRNTVKLKNRFYDKYRKIQIKLDEYNENN